MARDKVVFLIDSLAGGGAERVMSYILNGMDRSRFSPELYLLLRPEIGYPVAANIKVTHIGSKPIAGFHRFLISCLSTPVSLLARFAPGRTKAAVRHIKEAVTELAGAISALGSTLRNEQPAVIVVFLQTSIFVTLLTLLLFRLHIPVCCSDRILLSQELKQLRFPRFNRFILGLLYRRIDAYVAVSEEARTDILGFGVPHRRSVTIYNGLDLRDIREQASQPLDRHERSVFCESGINILNVGRLEPQKGQEYLLRAFALVRRQIPARLIVIGEGRERERLGELAIKLGIADDVIFAGWVANPFKYMASADLFVLSSLYEGFPNVLLEAMASGIPVISTDCPSGPAELLGDGEFGVLVPVRDSEKLAEEIISMGRDRERRESMAHQSLRRAEAFSMDRMIAAYGKVIAGLTAQSEER